MVVDLLERIAAARAPDQIVLVAGESSWTVRQFERLVEERAEALANEGVSRGEVYPLVVETDPEGLAAVLACWRLGATAAPLNPGLTTLERSEAYEALAGVPGAAQVILWTSGTSGRPRGVALSHDNLVSSCEAVADRLRLGASDCWLATLSMAHVGGLALVVRALLTGATLVAPGRLDVGRLSAQLDGAGGAGRRPVTHMSLVPTQLLHLLDHRGGEAPPATFQCALIGGASTPPDLVRRAVEDGWPLALTYGMTEMTSQVATAPPELVRAKPGTVGAPLRGVELEVVPEGEIVVRGPTRALGYLGPEASDIADDEGWYHTGDFGWLDDDGDLWVTGRRADRIVSGGVTIDAMEIEQVLRAYPGVAEVCVVGLEDPVWGQVVAAAVVATAEGVDLPELDARIRKHLSPAKRPKAWRLVTSLPRNANGKVQRDAVREVFQSGAG